MANSRRYMVSGKPASSGLLVIYLFCFSVSICVASSAGSLQKKAEQPLRSQSIPAARLKQYSDLSVQWMQEYLRVDTTNPPGHEARAAAFLKRILDQEGIENRIFNYAPGRANLWARLPHTTQSPERPIILLNHMDVVTSDAAHWKYPPFSGQIAGGYMYGRGAQDMKDEAMAQLMVLVMLKRERVALNRDVIFLATADEEVADTGSDWMIAHQRPLLGNSEYLITEGGVNLLENGKLKYIGVDVAEKSTFWLHVVAHGRAGHGSLPIADSAPNALVRALNRIIAYRTPLKVIPVVEESVTAMAAFEPPERAQEFRNIREAIKNKKFQDEVGDDESLNYLFRNTISLTMLGGSPQTNVIPPDAWANIDVRLLPGEDPVQFLKQIRDIAGPEVEINPLTNDFRMANASPTNTALFAAIHDVTEHYFPGTPVVPRLDSGTTESNLYRQLGMICYGYLPYTATYEESETEHNNNERIRVEELRRGPRMLFDLVAEVAGAK